MEFLKYSLTFDLCSFPLIFERDSRNKKVRINVESKHKQAINRLLISNKREW